MEPGVIKPHLDTSIAVLIEQRRPKCAFPVTFEDYLDVTSQSLG
jgi:hypothetical protein